MSQNNLGTLQEQIPIHISLIISLHVSNHNIIVLKAWHKALALQRGSLYLYTNVTFALKSIIRSPWAWTQGVRTKKIRYITLIFLVKAKLDLPPSPTCLKKGILSRVLIPTMDY
jgi:hypothetical protein